MSSSLSASAGSIVATRAQQAVKVKVVLFMVHPLDV